MNGNYKKEVKNLKGLCYIALIIGFFMFYQQNPIYTIIILVIFLGVYLFFKSRSSGGSNGILNFLSGRNPQQDNKIDDLITLMMLQQLLSPNPQNPEIRNNTEHKDKIEKIKQEVLNLLEED